MGHKAKKIHFLITCAVLSLATIVAYEPLRHNDFISYDDDVYIYDNPNVTGGLTWRSVVWAFATFKAPRVGHWQPLTRLSYMLDCELFGLEAGWHHLMSLGFHIANTLLLFWLLRRMTDRIWPSAFVAAAFALHPLHVESVAWATERRDMLSGFFMMLCIAAYIRYTERPLVKSYLLVCLTFALGLMSKSILVTLPFVLLLLDYWPLERFQFGAKSREEDSPGAQPPNSRTRRVPALRLIIEKIPLFILATISCVIAVVATRYDIYGLDRLTLEVRAVNSLSSYFGYIVKMLYPTRLGVLYPYPSELRMDVALLFPMGVAVLLVRYARGRGWLTVGLLWYLGMLVPVIGLVQVGAQAMADRYSYLPSIGIFIIVAWGARELSGNWRYRKVSLAIAAGAALTALLVCTRVQVQYWQDAISLYRHTLAVTEDNYLIHNNLADELREAGMIEEAIAHFEESRRINPEYDFAHYNLGTVFLKQGKLDEAVACFNEALKLQPNHPYYNYNMGLALSWQANDDNAIRYFKAALKQRPDWPDAYNNLGLVYIHMGDYGSAIENFNMALRLKPDYPVAIRNLKRAQLKQGKTDVSTEEQ
jgi:Tfp pilus assembly protein PilF